MGSGHEYSLISTCDYFHIYITCLTEYENRNGVCYVLLTFLGNILISLLSEERTWFLYPAN